MSSSDGQGLAPRAAAWRVLQAVAAGAWADAALERELARHPLPPADRALATELAYGAVRQRRVLDGWIDALGRVSAERQPPKLRWLLHVGLYQLLFSQRVPPAAAVNTTVELARQGGLGRLGPVVNGLLRALLRRRHDLPAGAEPWQGLTLPADPVQTFALRHSLPDWLATCLFSWLPQERAEAFARAANSPPALDLRVNRCRASRAAVLEAFTAAGVAVAALPQGPEALTLLDRSGDLRQLPGFSEGLWCVQDRSAQAVAPLLDPRPGERILDACAAPGGKATQLAELMGDQGEVWAVDRSAARLRRVEAILLDAPCSGLGTLARHADARWRIEPEAVSQLAGVQTQLLEAMVPLMAPGGRLLYATCTVHPMENQERIAAFQAAHPTWLLLREQQCWPGDPEGGDGFYAALLQAP